MGPDEVAELCLELVRRRKLRPDVQERAVFSNERAAKFIRQRREQDPEQAAIMDRFRWPVIPQGELRTPWPDGPSERVAEAFQYACLNTGAFICLCRSRPTVAREVLLAVCIEKPDRDDPYECYTISENCGVECWFEGYPPLYDRGPFLAFLRERPGEAIDFILRLINFATCRSEEAEARKRTRYVRRSEMSADEADDRIRIDLDGSGRQWLGDPRVFQWHHEWPHESRIVSCCLMALEFWLYERLERDEDVAPDLTRLLAESESLAFAGLLVDLGKRYPSLLFGVLRPLLGAWELYDLDLQVVVRRGSGSPAMIGWSMRQSPAAVARAREWFLMPHRSLHLREIAQKLLIQEPDMRNFFANVRAKWSLQLRSGEPHRLRLLVEMFDHANYTERPLGDGRIEVSFRWPDNLQRDLDSQQREQETETRLMMFPWQCRERLNRGNRLAAGEVLGFWAELLRLSETDEGGEDDPPEFSIPVLIDAVCGGVAVLYRFHREFVTEDPERERWCRAVLECVTVNPPRVGGLASESALGDRHWDAFAAEAGMVMLAANPRDPLARRLVARGAMAFRYATETLCLRIAFEARGRLGPDFPRLINLVVDWAAVRALMSRCQSIRLDITPYVDRASELEEAFVAGTLEAKIPSIVEANHLALKELAALVPPEYRALARRRRHVLDTGLDGRTLQAGLGWLDLRAAASGDERSCWMAAVRDLLAISLSKVPKVTDPQHGEFEGLPEEFDHWVLQTVSHAVRALGPGEDRTTLWKPVLDLPVFAHEWVERFFWYWFPDCPQEAMERETFFECWVAMIRYAVEHSGWDAATKRQHYIGDMIIQLMGFHVGIESLAGNEAYSPLFHRFANEFDRAAARWCVIPRVAHGFARFLSRSATAVLILPFLGRLSVSLESYNDNDWRERGLEDALVAYLRACWEKRCAEVSSDETYRRPFLAILKMLTSRGNHAAAAFNVRVVEQIGQQG